MLVGFLPRLLLRGLPKMIVVGVCRDWGPKRQVYEIYGTPRINMCTLSEGLNQGLPCA